MNIADIFDSAGRFIGSTIDSGIRGLNAYYDFKIYGNQREAELALSEKNKNDARSLEDYSQGTAYTPVSYQEVSQAEGFLSGLGNNTQTILVASAIALVGYAFLRK